MEGNSGPDEPVEERRAERSHRPSGVLRALCGTVPRRSGLGPVLVAHGTVHALELALPLFVVAWAGEFGAGPATLGIALAVAYGAFGLGAVPGGVLADRYGSRPLIACSLLGMGAAFLGLSVATGVAAVAVALTAWGVAASVYHPAGLALVSREGDGDALGAHGVAGNVGTVVGPVATALLLAAFDWRVVAGVLGVPAVLAAAIAGRGAFVDAGRAPSVGTPARTDGGRLTVRAVVRHSRRTFSGEFVAVFALVMLYGLYYRGMLTFLPEMAAGFGALAPVSVAGWTVGPGRYVYAGLLAAGVGGQYVGGRLVDRLPVELGLVGAFALLAVVGVLFATVGGVGPVLLLGGLLGVALFAAQPLYQAAVAKHAAGGIRGLSYGYTYAGVFGVGALGGALAGAVLRYASPTALFGVLAVVAVLGAAVALETWR